MPEGSPPRPAARVAYIRRLMALGAWVTGETGVELALRWGLAESTVQGDAAEASRAQREALGNTDEMRAVVVGMLNEAGRRARKDRSPQGTHTLLRLAEVWARITGVGMPAQGAPLRTTEEPVPFGWKRAADGSTSDAAAGEPDGDGSGRGPTH